MDNKLLVRELSEVLPLDDESLLQMIQNASKLPTQSAITEYWLGLLGESPVALDFIGKFSSQTVTKSKQPSPPNVRKTTTSVSSSSADPTLCRSGGLNASNPWNQPTLQKPKLNNKPRLSKNISSTTSQLLDKPKEKPSKQSEKKKKQTKVENLKDIEAVLRQLEVSNRDENSVCNCMARVHPLFEVVPNCLNCGKIICIKEGLRPCSSCGHELIGAEEKRSIIALLEAEKQELGSQEEVKSKEPVQEKTKKKKVTVSLGAGTNLWEQQTSMFEKLEKEKTQLANKQKAEAEKAKQLAEQNKEIQFYESQKELDPHLLRAKQNLENLLNFQANGTERTKIIDQASDFELPTGSNLNIWSSGVEKALQLKKQQKQLRKQEKKQRELVGKGKRVLDISIGKDGKAVMREVQSHELEESEDENDEDIKKLEEDLKKTKESKIDEDLKSVWDYEKDSKKWQKPVYMGKVSEESGATEDSNSFPSFGEWDRVQTAEASVNLEDIVATI